MFSCKYLKLYEDTLCVYGRSLPAVCHALPVGCVTGVLLAGIPFPQSQWRPAYYRSLRVQWTSGRLKLIGAKQLSSCEQNGAHVIPCK